MKIKFKEHVPLLLISIATLILCSCGKAASDKNAQTSLPTLSSAPISEKATLTLTKSPTSETKNTGEQAIFIANAANYDSVCWYYNLNGITNEASKISQIYSGAWTSGTDSTSMTVGGITKEMNGMNFYAIFKNGKKEIRSDAAVLNVVRNINITHNPTSESRDLGTDWYWDSQRSCARNNNIHLLFEVEGTNIDNIQWYIYTDHASPASNYDGVIGANSNMLSIPARSDLNGCQIYAVVQNNDGYKAESSRASYYVTYEQPIVRIRHDIYYDNFGEGGYINYMPSSANAGDWVKFTLAPTNSQAYYDVKISLCNSAGTVPYNVNGVDYSFQMPDDDVYITVYWSIP